MPSIMSNLLLPTLLLLLLFIRPTASQPLQNITLPLPAGTTNHGTPGLLCTPTQAFDVIVFYLLNYVAHAATVLVRPGERADDYFAAVIGALLFPALGLYRGIEAIFSGAISVRGDDLRRAAKSGALCIVVRGAEWEPEDGEALRGVILRRSKKDQEEDMEKMYASSVETKTDNDNKETAKESTIQPLERSLTGATLAEKSPLQIIPFSPPTIFSRFGSPIFVINRMIHGRHALPHGYRFAILPPDAQFKNDEARARNATTTTTTTRPTIEVSATFNVVKAVIALGQSAYALATLYRARGDQISQFGYAAFGLTVAPYAVMSIVNLVGNICRPEYSSLYMVESSVMDEARRRGAVFEGCVARVKEDEGLAVCGCMVTEGGGMEDLDEVRFGLVGGGGSSSSGGSGGGDATRHDDDETEKASRSPSTSSQETTGTSTETPKLEARFDTSSPHASSRRRTATSAVTKAPSIDQAKPNPCSSPSSPRTHAWPMAPLPKDLDYTHTANSAALLIPCHPPLVRKPTPCLSRPSTAQADDAARAPRPQLSALRLTRTWPLCSHRTYHARYTPSHTSLVSRRWRLTAYLTLLLIGLLPLAINGSLSRFQRGSIPARESSTWCAYTLQWLCFGLFTGVWWVWDNEVKEGRASLRMQVGPFVRVVGYVCSACPAVGGYVVVGEMLVRYGSCVWIGT